MVNFWLLPEGAVARQYWKHVEKSKLVETLKPTPNIPCLDPETPLGIFRGVVALCELHWAKFGLLMSVKGAWFFFVTNIEDFLLLLNAERAIFIEFPVSFSLRAEIALFRLVCSSTARIGTQTPKTKITNNPGKVFSTGFIWVWGVLTTFRGVLGSILGILGCFWLF